MSKVSYYTEEGLKKLRGELNTLKDIERPKASNAIAEARDKGDLSENAEYDAAKEAQGMLEMKISKLEETLAGARLIDESQLDISKVLVLSKVKIKNESNGMEMDYMIVADGEADLASGKISINSPVIGPEGQIIGKQEKIHPYDYEKGIVSPGTEARIFNTSCKFGIMICYDTVFPGVADTLSKKGAEIIFSPSRIVKEGIEPWKMYIQVRSLENRIPIIAPNVEDVKFGGNGLIVELTKEEKIVKTRITELKGECEKSTDITFSNYEAIREQRIEDRNNFQ